MGKFFKISRSVLLELCKGKDPNELPATVRAVVCASAMAEVQCLQLESVTVNPEVNTAQSANPVVIEDPSRMEKREGNFTSPLSLEVVCETYEAGQSPRVIDSQGVEEQLQVSQRIIEGANQDSVIFIPQSNLESDKFIGEPSDPLPKILQRNKDKIIEVGECSKSRGAAKVISIFSPPVLRPSTLQKRKNQEKSRASPAKPKKKAQKQARIVTNSDGLVEVQVNFAHCSRIATGLGFQTTQVQQAVQIDNEERVRTIIEERSEERETEPLATETNEETQMEEREAEDRIDQGEHLTDFDPDSDDELSSDFD